jgi:hypothetical protein
MLNTSKSLTKEVNLVKSRMATSNSHLDNIEELNVTLLVQSIRLGMKPRAGEDQKESTGFIVQEGTTLFLRGGFSDYFHSNWRFFTPSAA